MGFITEPLGLSPKEPDLPVLPPTPTKADTGVTDAAKAMANMLKKRKGALSTIATTSQGITGAAPTQKAEAMAGAGGYG